MKSLITILIILASFVGLQAQPLVDGFMKPKGTTSLSMAYTYYTYDKFYGKDMLHDLSGTAHTISFFGITGLTDWLNLQASTPYAFVDGVNGIQNMDAYLKISPFNKQLKNKDQLTLMYTPGISVPFVDYDTESLGANTINTEHRAVVQYKFYEGYFIMAQGGYTHQFEDQVPSSVNYALKVGLAHPGYYIDIWLDSQYSLSGNNYMANVDVPFRTYMVSFNIVGLTYYEPLKKGFGFAVTPSYVINGTNTARAISLSASLNYTFSHLPE